MYRMFSQPVPRKKRFGDMALKVLRNRQAQTVRGNRRSVDYGHVSPPKRLNAGANHDEDTVGMVGAQWRRARHHRRGLVANRHKSVVNQDQSQVGRVFHGSARKRVFALHHLSDDFFASGFIAHFQQICDQLFPERFIILGGNSSRASRRLFANDDSIRRRRRAKHFGGVPIKIGKIRQIPAFCSIRAITFAPGEVT